MLKVVIVDDEKSGVIALELSLKEFCPDVEVVGTAFSALDGIKEIQLKNPDLVFCNIEMPFMSGIEMIEGISARNFDVIFVTAYNQYAIKAFKLSATDYLLKPVNIIELINAIKRIQEKRKFVIESNLKIENLRLALSGKIGLPCLDGSEFVKIDEIIRVEADGSYSKVFTTDGKMRYVTKNLKYFEDSLENESFYRTHKSHLINLEFIKKYSPIKDGGVIQMSDGSEILISRNVKTEFSEILNRFIK